MEPFRPTIDRAVYALRERGIATVPDARKILVGVLSARFKIKPDGESPLSQVLVRLAQSVARSFETGKAELTFPRKLLPLEGADDDIL